MTFKGMIPFMSRGNPSTVMLGEFDMTAYRQRILVFKKFQHERRDEIGQ